jgi:hypothetical protein
MDRNHNRHESDEGNLFAEKYNVSNSVGDNNYINDFNTID